MLNRIKWSLLIIVGLLIVASVAGYVILRASLPQLSGHSTSVQVDAPLNLSRDALGHAIIEAADRNDAAFALGVAHAQDRFFQMDLQRRSAAGELSDWVGQAAQKVDKQARFHQFTSRASRAFDALPSWQQTLLTRYSEGVNSALDEMTMPPLEYLLAGVEVRRWKPEDSLLVIYSMYMDLQRGQVRLDWARHAVQSIYGDDMLAFLTQPSEYQAALDGSRLDTGVTPIPDYPHAAISGKTAYQRDEPKDIGSNNWAVTGTLTPSGSAMLANDMHLGLRVPIIWYRTQLNYRRNNQAVSLTGVSLPGLPGIVVGTNGHIAWGFTNANLDTVDWVRLSPETPTQTVSYTLGGDGEHREASFALSDYGPVRTFDGERYALSWVAHQPYAVNLSIANLDLATHVDDAAALAPTMGIPTQNMMIVDAAGNATWTPAGALPFRTTATTTALDDFDYDPGWATRETDVPRVMNPSGNRLWTANARVIATADLPRFGDGGYALGARAQQIRDALMQQDRFDEQAFYAIQLDNRALFLTPWHTLLRSTLETMPDAYREDIRYLDKWQACACADSVGYTLVRHFRSAIIDSLLGPVLQRLEDQNVDSQPLLRGVEPALWQLLETRPEDWLPDGYKDYTDLLIVAYEQARKSLLARYGEGNGLADLRWGKVNALTIRHPFAAQIPLLGQQLNMPSHPGFGDSYMPAVQRPAFGASQRLFVRPGNLENAILTLPGGQSGHPLSPYFRSGFTDYVSNAATPLLPQPAEVSRCWQPARQGQ